MQSLEQKSNISEPITNSSPFLRNKIEQHTNRLLESLHQNQKHPNTNWIVLDLTGKIIDAGAIPSRAEVSESLF